MGKEIFIVEVTPRGQGMFSTPHISDMGYSRMEDAIEFINSRRDNPKRVGEFLLWYGTNNRYRILSVRVK